MPPQSFELLERARPSTLRERWLRLLRDLYAVPSVHVSLMEEQVPMDAAPTLVLLQGGAPNEELRARSEDLRRRTQQRSRVEGSVSRNRIRSTSRLVRARSSEEQAPTQGDGDDIDAPDTPPSPTIPEGDAPRPLHAPPEYPTRARPVAPADRQPKHARL